MNDQPSGQSAFAIPISLDAAPRSQPPEADFFHVKVTYAEFRISLNDNRMFFVQLEVLEGLRTGSTYAGDRVKRYIMLPDDAYDVDGRPVVFTDNQQKKQRGKARGFEAALISMGHPRLEIRERFSGANPDAFTHDDLLERECWIEYEPPPEDSSYSSSSFRDPNVSRSQFEAARKQVDPLGNTASV